MVKRIVAIMMIRVVRRNGNDGNGGSNGERSRWRRRGAAFPRGSLGGNFSGCINCEGSLSTAVFPCVSVRLTFELVDLEKDPLEDVEARG